VRFESNCLELLLTLRTTILSGKYYEDSHYIYKGVPARTVVLNQGPRAQNLITVINHLQPAKDEIQRMKYGQKILVLSRGHWCWKPLEGNHKHKGWEPLDQDFRPNFNLFLAFFFRWFFFLRFLLFLFLFLLFFRLKIKLTLLEKRGYAFWALSV